MKPAHFTRGSSTRAPTSNSPRGASQVIRQPSRRLGESRRGYWGAIFYRTLKKGIIPLDRSNPLEHRYGLGLGKGAYHQVYVLLGRLPGLLYAREDPLLGRGLNQKGQGGHAQSVSLGLGRLLKPFVGEGDGGNAPPLQLHSVTHGGAGAGPSEALAVYHHISLRDHPVHHRLGDDLGHIGFLHPRDPPKLNAGLQELL